MIKFFFKLIFSNGQDSAATFVLRKILRTFAAEGTRICLCGLHDFQVSLFQRAGMSSILEGNMFDSMAAAVADIETKIDCVEWRQD